MYHLLDRTDFDAFVSEATPRLQRALIGSVGSGRAEDCTAEAIAWGYEHRAELATMTNPIGYLFRVGQSKGRRRRTPLIVSRRDEWTPEFEPGLVKALGRLPESQRVAVWLAHGCQWTHAEIASATGTSTSTVATHVARALHRLRRELGVVDADR